MHRLVNFKNFRSAQINLFPSFTLLVGRNGSGKTNLIEGIELLAALAEGRPLRDIADVGRGNGLFEVRGGLGGCLFPGEKSFTLGLTFHGITYDLEIVPGSIDGARKAYIAHERLQWGDRKHALFEARSDGTTGVTSVKYDNYAKGPNKPTKNVSSDTTILSRLDDIVPKSASGNDADHREWAEGLRSLSHSFVLDARPHLMRGYERIGDTSLRRDGSNVSSVLHALSKSPEGAERLARILAVLQQLPEEPFIAFEFIDTRVGDVLLGLQRADGSLVDGRVLSDGTLRALAVLTALETVEEGSQVVLEEFDNGIHPSRAATLIAAVLEIAKRRTLAVIATTHNPATLDAIPEEHLGGVHVCVWDAQAKTSRVERLLDLSRIDVLLEHGQLGDLVTKDIFERVLNPNLEEAQRSASKAWLESRR